MRAEGARDCEGSALSAPVRSRKLREIFGMLFEGTHDMGARGGRRVFRLFLCSVLFSLSWNIALDRRRIFLKVIPERVEYLNFNYLIFFSVHKQPLQEVEIGAICTEIVKVALPLLVSFSNLY